MSSILSSPTIPATLSRRLSSGRFRSQPLIQKPKKKSPTIRFSVLNELSFLLAASPPAADISVAVSGDPSFSPASYYTSLGLFVISVPGLWSLIKRSVKSKIVQKNFVKEGTTKANQVAGEILSFFTRNNFIVSDRGDAITYSSLSLFCLCVLLNVGGIIKIMHARCSTKGLKERWCRVEARQLCSSSVLALVLQALVSCSLLPFRRAATTGFGS